MVRHRCIFQTFHDKVPHAPNASRNILEVFPNGYSVLEMTALLPLARFAELPFHALTIGISREWVSG